MAAAQVNFSIANNQDWEAEFTLLNDEDGNIPHIIAQSKIRMQLRPTAHSPDVLFEAVVAPFNADQPVNMTVTDEPAGEVRLSVRAAKMRQIPDGAYVYDIIVVRPTGRTYRPIMGTLTLARGVTELP